MTQTELIPIPSSSSISAPRSRSSSPGACARPASIARSCPSNGRRGLRAAAARRRVILSGGPASVTEDGSPRAPQAVFEPACRSSASAMASRPCACSSAARSRAGMQREFGRADVEIDEACAAVRRRLGVGRALSGLDEPWRPRHRAARRASRSSAVSENAPFAIIADEAALSTRRSSTPRSSTRRMARSCSPISSTRSPASTATGRWPPSATQAIDAHPRAGRQGRVICGLSGGVDSAVAAVLIHEAIGDQLTCIFVDHGLMRQGEARGSRRPVPRATTTSRSSMSTRREHVPRRARRRRATPRRSARPSAGCSSTCSRRRRKKLGGAEFLAQGTLYPDVIESVSFTGGPSVTIKSHHNVGGLPERMNMKLVEPLRELFKDEVRALGRELGLPEAFVGRHPFPGPGLAIRCPGGITPREARHPAQGRRRSISTRSARPASTTRSGRPSPCCCRCGPSA